MFFDFLTALAANNNREWFGENRIWYDNSRKEVEDLIAACIAEIGQLQDLGNISAKESMFRIYRDVRFGKNKDPYKQNFSALISRSGRKDMGVFSYYIHFQPGASFFASGLYEPTGEQLTKIRQEIDYNSEELQSILQAKSFKGVFGILQGNQLKTSPKGYPKDHPQIDLLRFTQFFISSPLSDAEILGNNFSKLVADRVLVAQPFLQFLDKAIS